MDLNAFVGENLADFMRDFGILPAHQLRPCLNDSHFTAEAAISLRQFEACISAADHDQMRRQDVELESFDMGHRVSGLESRNVRNCCVRAHIQEHLGADKVARSSVIQAHFQRFRGDEAPGPHDQFGAARFVVVQVRRDLRFDHVALAPDNLRHVDLDRAGHRAELPAIARHMRDLGAVNFILAGQTGDVGAGAADPPALDDCGPPSRSRHVPGGELAAAAAAKDQNVDLFGLRHEHPPRFRHEGPRPLASNASNVGQPIRWTGIGRPHRTPQSPGAASLG